MTNMTACLDNARLIKMKTSCQLKGAILGHAYLQAQVCAAEMARRVAYVHWRVLRTREFDRKAIGYSRVACVHWCVVRTREFDRLVKHHNLHFFT